MQDLDIKRLQRKLELGMIDKRTYIYEMKRLERKKMFKSLIIVLFLVIVMLKIFPVNKTITHIEDLNNIPEPIQKLTVGSTYKIINNEKIKLNYIAKYTLYGYVVDVHEYWEGTMQGNLSPRDIGMVWGFLSDKSNFQKLNFSSAGNRFLNWSTNDSTWLKSVGGWDRIQSYVSNNHLIPSDDNVEKLIKSIKTGDYVKIEGYLVNVRCDKANGGYFNWNSSTTRSDKGDGACEIIYVTNVEWLKD